ncbi:sulfotransferase domain-containing protein [Methylocaldum gracile]|uniref:sulfotransferase domain-containing protein n=1 Tax=Methylocaldum sp. 0917 TaxID=2485163 RepID=UPI001060F7D6
MNNHPSKRIVLSEYPKSGGSWVVSMLGDALQLPKRDIYVRDGFNLFDISKHPWYESASSLDFPQSCIIKSHELPKSPLIDFSACFFHLIRDGRDVVVSKYFYEKDFCVENGIYDEFSVVFDEYVARIAGEWRNYVFAWLNAGFPYYLYESFLKEPTDTLHKIINDLELDTNIPEFQIIQAVEANSKEKFKRALDQTFRHNTFVRKATHGDWRNYFNHNHVATFKDIAGDALIYLRYEKDLDW